jgi:hypothetical protein
MFAVADAVRLPLADQTVDLVFGSPPYLDARTYGIDAQRDCPEWVEWMLKVVAESLRVCRGAVVIVADGSHDGKRNYRPAVEGLMWRWYAEGWSDRGPGTVKIGSMYRPCYYHRFGIPGSGGDQWFRADVEHIACFKRPGALPWSENTAMGHKPRWAPGGEMSYRLSDGTRRDQWGQKINGVAERRRDGKRMRCERPSHIVMTKADRFRESEDGSVKGEHAREICAIANPGNLIHLNVGGGVMGHKICHRNEAPFPEPLAEFFIRSLCPPGGLVLDPFSGSGTSVAVARKWGRRGIGFDIRLGQCLDGTERLQDTVPLLATS